MKEHRELLERYMKSWVLADRELFLSTLHPDLYLVECYGASYRGTGEAERWFTAWNNEGRVTDWFIKETYWDEAQETLFATWEFHVDYPGDDEPCFDGITVLRAREGKISELYEFSMKHDRFRPYQ